MVSVAGNRTRDASLAVPGREASGYLEPILWVGMVHAAGGGCGAHAFHLMACGGARRVRLMGAFMGVRVLPDGGSAGIS